MCCFVVLIDGVDIFVLQGVFGNQSGCQLQCQYDCYWCGDFVKVVYCQVVIFWGYLLIGYCVVVVGIDVFGVVGDKSGVECGEEGMDLVDEDQKGIEQVNQYVVEQSVVYCGLLWQMSGFQGDEGEGGVEIECDVY